MTTGARTAAGTAIAATVLSGCFGGADPVAPRLAGGLTPAQERLAELAHLAATASYDATYSLRAASGDAGSIRIVVAPPSYRVDVALTGSAPSLYFQRAGTAVSCSTKASRPSCFLVARPGEPVPELFDPGVQRLFSDAVADLAARPERYVVLRAASSAPSQPPGTECFDVRRVDESPAAAPVTDPTGFETGQYCFGTDGVLTRLAVSTGTLTLTKRGPAPTAAVFEPPATPVALPPLPTPS